MGFDKDELQVLRQWFSSVQDLSHPDFLEPKDFILAYKIYKALGWRIPNSISDELKKIAHEFNTQK